jgi:hypothetical protein
MDDRQKFEVLGTLVMICTETEEAGQSVVLRS